MDCPDFETLLAALEDPSVATEVARHADSGCRPCADRMRLLRELMRTLGRGGITPAPDEAWSRAAAGLASEGPPRRALRWTGIEMEAGTELVLRGGALCQQHLRYSAGPFDLELALLDPATLVGTVTPVADRAPEPVDLDGAVCVLDGPGGPRQTALESNGDFRFEGIDPGRYLLLIETPHFHVVVEDVDLTPEDRDR